MPLKPVFPINCYVADAVIAWDGRKFPCPEALQVLQDILSFELKRPNGDTMRREAAITYSALTGVYTIYYVNVESDSDGIARDPGFVAKVGFNSQ